MDLGLAGRSCIVTGAGRGIGRATAVRLCEAGAQVLLASRTESELADAAEECGRRGAPAHGRATHLAVDIADPEAADRLHSEALDRFGAVDVLVNNAGTAKWRDLDEVPEEDWYAAWELNVMAPLRLIKATAPGMAERGWGRIVNVSSSAGKRPSQQIGEYSVAKAAELSLSRLYADRYASTGVRINAICPGAVASELWMEPGGLLDQSQELHGHTSREEALQAASSSRPLGRLAEVEEIADAILFLCSERSSYVSGAAWSVDGGSVQVII